ncbi:zinc finger, MYND-type protein [Rhodosporidium toruloides NP11] [Rhodotorula toruloides]|uniref:BY PROTMAP: gi/472587446/gb/EMS24942.1/ zinc finger, MYND-type protein [Rhodosporidium toruloides NP11] n=1 Tax=Rhodotorula toruloides TaxID=5286 RepID=A0A0K3CS27_RHOTO|nr:zinc finger, MYND-type protein [Rhodosporidium toruloides NP11] [Rhodotorula toruloides]
MSTQAEHPCSVCDRKTKTTCGGCRTVYFCDRSCQAAIWSTHKWLCKNSPDIFTFPALTTDEAATLKQLVGGSDPVVKTAMKRIKLSERDGWQSGKYETFIDDLARDDCPVPEPRRSLRLLELHFLLRDLQTRSVSPSVTPTPWTDVAYTHWISFDSIQMMNHTPQLRRPGANPLVLLNQPFRQLLIYFTLAHRRRAKQSLPKLQNGSDLVEFALDRLENSGTAGFEQYAGLLGINGMSIAMADDDGSPMPYETPAVNAFGAGGGAMNGQMMALMRELGLDGGGLGGSGGFAGL